MILTIFVGVVIVAVATYLYITLKKDCIRCLAARKRGDEKGIYAYCGQALCQSEQ